MGRTSKVINVNLTKEPFDIYIGRGSKWGNPFVVGKDGTREDVLFLYEQYIYNNPDLLNNLYLLKNKILGCHCKPLDCHGDILLEIIERLKI